MTECWLGLGVLCGNHRTCEDILHTAARDAGLLGGSCTHQPVIGQHGEVLANHVSSSSGGKSRDIKISCHLFVFFSPAIFGVLYYVFFFFLQKGPFRVIRDEHKRLKRLTMILWRLLLMCVTSALRAASSQTQEGRPINYLSTSALQQTVTEKLISHIFF